MFLAEVILFIYYPAVPIAELTLPIVPAAGVIAAGDNVNDAPEDALDAMKDVNDASEDALDATKDVNDAPEDAFDRMKDVKYQLTDVKYSV